MNNQEEQKTTVKFPDIHLVEKKFNFAQKEWKIQKIGRILLFLFLVAGLVGLFGDGWLSQKTVHGNSFKIKYHWIIREEAPTKLYIYLQNPADITQISFNSSYLKDVNIFQTMPTAVTTKTTERRIYYSFKTDTRSVIIFYLIADNAGFKELGLEVNGQMKRLKQFIYF